MLAVVEVSTGRRAAILMALAGNLLLFGLLGAVVLVSLQRRAYFPVTAGLLLLAVVMFAWWGAGFDPRYLDVWAVLLALAFYGGLLFLAKRLAHSS